MFVAETCSTEQRQRLADYGTEVVPVALDADGQVDLQSALLALARRGIMHVLMEGGAKMLGSAFDQNCIDHVAAFIAPKLIGGWNAPSPIGGRGLPLMAHAYQLQNVRTSTFDGDVLVEGNVVYR